MSHPNKEQQGRLLVAKLRALSYNVNPIRDSIEKGLNTPELIDNVEQATLDIELLSEDILQDMIRFLDLDTAHCLTE